MFREALYAVLGLVGLVVGLDWALSRFDDPREPSRVRPKIPLFGHIFGLLQHGPLYYDRTSKQSKAEIYTVPMATHKFYITNTTRLTPLVQKVSKTVSFRPFMQLAAKTFAGISDEAYDLLGTDWMDDFAHGMDRSLAPGKEMDAQNLRMGLRALVDVEELLQKKEVGFLDWVKHTVVQASSCGVYGQRHPFLDPKIEEAWWVWQSYLGPHLLGLDITGKGYKARQTLFDAYRTYLADIPEDASLVVRERRRLMTKGNMSREDQDKSDASFVIAVFGNTMSTLFWTLWELLSRPELLEEVREELANNAIIRDQEGGSSFTLDVEGLKHRCPILLSAFQEMQRMRTAHAAIRKVTADTMLDGRYMLKAGNFLQMPGHPIHMSEPLWGEDATVFDPYRFMPGKRKRALPPQNAFAAWGAAPYLCPARQFATTEVLIVVALVALRADVVPVNKKEWDTLEIETGSFAAVQEPKKDPKVRVTPREEWAGEWKLKFGESRVRISLASG